jgi:hypothetical protein
MFVRTSKPGKTVQYSTVPYSTVLHSTIKYSTYQWYSALRVAKLDPEVIGV